MKNIDKINEKINGMIDKTSQMVESQEEAGETMQQENGNSTEASHQHGFLYFLMGVLILVGLVFGTVKLVKHIKDKHDYTYCDTKYEEEPISSPILKKKGKCHIINPITTHVIVKDIDWYNYADSKDSIILFAKNGKRGFCNILTNKVILEPTAYTRAWMFSEGLAAVEKDGYIGFVNTDGKIAIACKYPYRGNPLTEFVFHDGHCVVADTSNKLGVIDSKGHWVLKPQYDGIKLAKDYAIVYTKGDFKKQIDYSGNVLQDGIIDRINDIYYDVNYNDNESGEPASGRVQNLEYYAYEVGCYAGLVNSKGQFLTPPIYTFIIGITPTLFCATLQDDCSKVFINQNGQIVSDKPTMKTKK